MCHIVPFGVVCGGGGQSRSARKKKKSRIKMEIILGQRAFKMSTKKKKTHHLVQFHTESHTLKQRVNINFVLNIFGSNAKIVRFLPRLFRMHIPGNKSNNLVDLKTLRKKEAPTHHRQEIFFLKSNWIPSDTSNLYFSVNE